MTTIQNKEEEEEEAAAASAALDDINNMPDYFITDNKKNGVKIRNPEHIAYMEANYNEDDDDDDKKKTEDDKKKTEDNDDDEDEDDKKKTDDDDDDNDNGEDEDGDDDDVDDKNKSKDDEKEDDEDEDEAEEKKSPPPKKYIKDSQTEKFIRNPEYDRFMGLINNTPSFLSKQKTSTKLNSISTSGGIVDLSKDFIMQSNHLINPGSRLMEMDFKQFKEVRRVTVIENGILVADYKQKGVSAHDTYNLFSSTKSITSMLIGILINLPDVELSVNDTLEDIFKNNHNYAWSRIKKEYNNNNNNNNTNEYNYKKSVRLEEILTMSSGLKSMMGGYKGIINMKSVSVADAPGSDLPTSLAAPDYDPSIRGKFHYMASSNILSYIIKEKSGLSPREFADKYVFCHLGINHNLMKWDTNSDGIETSYSQLKLTTIQMCKVAQLYLQDGYYSPKCLIPLLSENWINSTQTKHIYGNAGFDHWYGYLWALYDKKYHKQHTIDDVWVAPGFNGQMIALSKETNRVVAISRLPIPMQCDDLIHYKKCVIKLLCPSRNYSQLINGPEHNIPKKFIKCKGKMIRNPEYDRFMESKKIHSDSIGGLQQDSHHSGRRNSYTNPYI